MVALVRSCSGSARKLGKERCGETGQKDAEERKMVGGPGIEIITWGTLVVCRL